MGSAEDGRKILIGEKITEITAELEKLFERCSYEEVGSIIKRLGEARRIYVAGAGRAGYVMRGFAMRLMHAGFSAFVIGDTEAPAAGEGDLLILESGSGETETLKAYARKALKLGLSLMTITSSPKSFLGTAAHITLRIPAPTKAGAPKDGQTSGQPMGSLFEQALMIFTDALVLGCLTKSGLDYSRHLRTIQSAIDCNKIK